MRVERGSQWLSFALVGATGAASLCRETATYANALPGVTVAYSADNDAVKEAITLADATAPHVFAFTVRMSGGLTARAATGGTVEFVDGGGTVQFAFASPFVDDATGTPAGHSTAITVQLTPVAGGVTVTDTIDAAWLADPARRYPVILDPTIAPHSMGAGSTSLGCTLDSGAPAFDYCPYATLYTGAYNGHTYRTALAFPDVASTLPTQSIVHNAALGLWVGGGVGGAQSVEMHGLSRPFTNGVTWNTDDGTHAWTNAGGDFTPAAAWTTSVNSGTTGYAQWYPTHLVAGWVNGGQPNNGFLFKAADEGVQADMQFVNATYASSSVWPYLSVTYTPIDGLPRTSTFQRQALNDRLDLSVNVTNGLTTLHAHDLGIAGTGLDLNVDRYFTNYGATSIGEVGVNGTLSFGRNVEAYLWGDGTVSYRDPTGYWTPFFPDGHGGYTPYPGVDATLTLTSPPNNFTLTYHASGTKYLFTNGFQTATVDKNGNTLTYTYNASNYVTAVTDTQGRRITLGYLQQNGVSLLNTVTDANGPTTRTVTYTYDPTANTLLTVTDASGGVTRYAYDSSDILTRITDPKGNVTKVGFNYSNNQTTSVTRVTDVGAGTGPTTTFTYGSGNTVVTDANSHATTYAYDAMSRVTSVVDALGHTQAATYNADSNVLTATDALSPGNVTTMTWGANTNESLTKTQWAANGSGAAMSTSGTFTTTGHPYLPDSGTDAQGSQLHYTYDSNGNLTQMMGNSVHVDAMYNSDGTLQWTKDAMATANPTTYAYTPNSHAAGTHFTKVVVTPPSPLGAVTINLDSLSRVSSTVDGNGKTTSFTYDNLDRITRITYNGDTSCASRTTCTDAVYDNNGNLMSLIDATGTTTFTYGKQNHQLTKTLPGAGSASVTYTYDGVGNVLTLVDAGGTVTYGYDAVNNLASLAEPGGSCTTPTTKCTTFAYDANNRRTSTVYPTSPVVTISQVYFNNGALKSVIATKAGTNTPLTSFTYAYSNATGGDIALRSAVTDGVANTTTTYGYDFFNRLTAASKSGTTYAYGYDNNGNLTTATLNGTSLFAGTPSYNNANQLTALGTTAFTYDGNGNQQSGTAGTFVYNAKNQTLSITPMGGGAFPMTYAGDSQVERITAGTASYTNDSLGVGSETNGGTTTYYTRTPGGRLVDERIVNGGTTTPYYYLFDGLGSVVALVDTSATVQDTYSYDPYGNVTPGGGNSVANPWQYTGGYYDSATKLVKLGQRYYDPSLGRFTQLDPKGGGYAYASDNPVNFTDPSGLDDCSDQNSSCNAPPPGQDVADPCGPDCSPSAEVPRNLLPSENEARKQLDLSRADFREAIHAVKDANSIPANGDLLFRTTDPGKGDVYYNGENVGNLYDELHITGGDK